MGRKTNIHSKDWQAQNYILSKARKSKGIHKQE